MANLPAHSGANTEDSFAPLNIIYLKVAGILSSVCVRVWCAGKYLSTVLWGERNLISSVCWLPWCKPLPAWFISATMWHHWVELGRDAHCEQVWEDPVHLWPNSYQHDFLPSLSCLIPPLLLESLNPPYKHLPLQFLSQANFWENPTCIVKVSSRRDYRDEWRNRGLKRGNDFPGPHGWEASDLASEPPLPDP